MQFVAAHSQRRLEVISGRALLVGCDVETIKFLCGPQFDLNLFAVDRDMADIENCKTAVAHIPGMQNRLSFLANDCLAFRRRFFLIDRLGRRAKIERCRSAVDEKRFLRNLNESSSWWNDFSLLLILTRQARPSKAGPMNWTQTESSTIVDRNSWRFGNEPAL